MSTEHDDLTHLIDAAKIKFNQYAASQMSFISPQAHISISIESNGMAHVHMDIEYNGIQYKFESVQEKDIDNVYTYLNSQPTVRAKYGNGNTCSLEATTSRIHLLIERFKNKDSPLYLYSGFIVSDSQTGTFLGLVTLGGGTEPGTAEISRLNREDCWNRSNNNSSNVDTDNRKIYSGVGTIETCVLLQYATRLKQNGYTVRGEPLKAVISTARLDNEGSWKSACKAGMILDTVDVFHHYGHTFRYLLRKTM
ncbi:hypothetical protein I4U23_012024 [Adineta vaga]|nr:hypothetical protein I4U23_012024 [Adineta vaga]